MCSTDGQNEEPIFSYTVLTDRLSDLNANGRKLCSVRGTNLNFTLMQNIINLQRITIINQNLLEPGTQNKEEAQKNVWCQPENRNKLP